MRALGQGPAGWSAQESGLFADTPHLLLEESYWDEWRLTATNRYYVVDAASAQVTAHASTTQGYTRAGYEQLLASAGFARLDWHGALGNVAEGGADLITVVARI